jgi:hypothetical protein
MIIVISWEIRRERNARRISTSCHATNVVIGNVKAEAEIWYMAGAKHLSNVIMGEWDYLKVVLGCPRQLFF